MAKPSRRSVLRAGVVLAATTAPLGLARSATSMVAGGTASGLRRATFQPHVGTPFTLTADGTTHRAVLKKVADVRTAPRGHDRKFRLVFHVTGSTPASGTYRIGHRRIGAMDLFVNPIGGEPGVYEAIMDAR